MIKYKKVDCKKLYNILLAIGGIQLIKKCGIFLWKNNFELEYNYKSNYIYNIQNSLKDDLDTLFNKYHFTYKKEKMKATKLFFILKQKHNIPLILLDGKNKIILISKYNLRKRDGYDENIEITLKFITYSFNKLKNIIKIFEDKVLDEKHFYLYDNLIKINSFKKPLFVSMHRKYIIELIKNRILQKENKFLNNRGISFLLYGKARTGKSSIVNYIGYRFKDRLGMVKLINSIEGLNKLDELIKKEKYKLFTKEDSNEKDNKLDVFLIDEVDKILDIKKCTDKNITLIKLMDILNNIPKNMIIILTTNYKDKLPEALIRKGRCDYHIEFTDYGNDEINEFLCKLNIDKNSLEKYMLETQDIKRKLNETENPAELTEICRRYLYHNF